MRYLQYLLSINYFALPGEPQVDKSNWIASVTAISGCFNGSLGCYSPGLNDKFLLQSDCKKIIETLPATVVNKGFRVVAAVQNVFMSAGTQDVEPENVVKVFKQRLPSSLKSILVEKRREDDHDIMYELGNQYGMIMDLNHESVGFNKRKEETHLEYINRLANNDFAGKSHDLAGNEFPPAIY